MPEGEWILSSFTLIKLWTKKHHIIFEAKHAKSYSLVTTHSRNSLLLFLSLFLLRQQKQIDTNTRSELKPLPPSLSDSTLPPYIKRFRALIFHHFCFNFVGPQKTQKERRHHSKRLNWQTKRQLEAWQSIKGRWQTNHNKDVRTTDICQRNGWCERYWVVFCSFVRPSVRQANFTILVERNTERKSQVGKKKERNTLYTRTKGIRDEEREGVSERRVF